MLQTPTMSTIRACLASADWFLSRDPKERLSSDDALRFFAQEAWIFKDVLWSPARPVRYFPRMVAHLFSGERRSGDVQSFLEAAGFSALSIDVVFDLGRPARPGVEPGRWHARMALVWYDREAGSKD